MTGKTNAGRAVLPVELGDEGWRWSVSLVAGCSSSVSWLWTAGQVSLQSWRVHCVLVVSMLFALKPGFPRCFYQCSESSSLFCRSLCITAGVSLWDIFHGLRWGDSSAFCIMTCVDFRLTVMSAEWVMSQQRRSRWEISVGHWISLLKWSEWRSSRPVWCEDDAFCGDWRIFQTMLARKHSPVLPCSRCQRSQMLTHWRQQYPSCWRGRTWWCWAGSWEAVSADQVEGFLQVSNYG